ncbi:GNAT family protein [Metapseudomonas otitidis]|uniref:GNAT family N-acetyltransferase n=1 Tax=Metapseudomonas otitidis TaxID=319939 RepID=UPI000D1BAB6F|nr:GNAT family N-acetyltransferase [Pseudomonas otitidis]
MIRLARPDEYADLVDIWLEASLQAHDFIPEAFWHSQRDAVFNHYLPAAENWVVEESGQVRGFLSMVENHLAALFIHPAHVKAVGFYRSAGFEVVAEARDAATGQPELTLRWLGELGAG